MSLVLYFAPWSSASTSAWAIEELGVPHEKKKLDLKAKDTQTPEFLKLNPNGLVPLLVHDGVPIFESAAIIAYLGETFGVEKKLFPAPGTDRGLALQWLVWANVTLASAFMRMMMNKDNPAVADAALAATKKNLGILDAALAGKQYIVGDTFTFADLQLAGATGWMGQALPMKDYANITAWQARCTARPAFKASMTL